MGCGIVVRTQSRRRVTLARRDYEALGDLDRMHIKQTCQIVNGLVKILYSARNNKSMRKILNCTIANFYIEIMKIIIVEVPDPGPRLRHAAYSFASMEAYLKNVNVRCSEMFRFRSFDTLRRLVVAFRLPEGVIKVHGYKTNAEEVIMI